LQINFVIRLFSKTIIKCCSASVKASDLHWRSLAFDPKPCWAWNHRYLFIARLLR